MITSEGVQVHRGPTSGNGQETPDITLEAGSAPQPRLASVSRQRLIEEAAQNARLPLQVGKSFA